jgi:hypothetical protein
MCGRWGKDVPTFRPEPNPHEPNRANFPEQQSDRTGDEGGRLHCKRPSRPSALYIYLLSNNIIITMDKATYLRNALAKKEKGIGFWLTYVVAPSPFIPRLFLPTCLLTTLPQLPSPVHRQDHPRWRRLQLGAHGC